MPYAQLYLFIVHNLMSVLGVQMKQFFNKNTKSDRKLVVLSDLSSVKNMTFAALRKQLKYFCGSICVFSLGI